jgi:2-polyprenyl-6-methoxyphenol hydroxylase-like FAD-dependent oxidoreductase
VAVDRLEKWYCEGLICIGDAAHAMSPVGGVGINLALQDAVATANILYPVLSENKNPGSDVLEQIQKRREPPTKSTQRLQLTIQNNFLSRRLNEDKNMPPPLMLRLFNRFRLLRRIPAQLIGIGMRAEHIQTPEIN